MKSLPLRTKVLIVGAGPVGLTHALALLKQGLDPTDSFIIVVDKLPEAQNSSRAFAVHAATLEALEDIDLADALSGLSTKAKSLHLLSQSTSPLLSFDYYEGMKGHTKYPYMHIVPQDVTERLLNTKLKERGVDMRRGKEWGVVGMRGCVDDDEGGDVGEDEVMVIFEGGDRVVAKYVIGADGAKSMVRELANVPFLDPRTNTSPFAPYKSNTTDQVINADISFTHPLNLPPHGPAPQQTSRNFEMTITLSPATFVLLAPFPSPSTSTSTSEEIRSPELYRFATAIPPSYGTPPDEPSLSYIQRAFDTFGPKLPSHIKIKEVRWSKRFRTMSAVADTFFTRFSGGGGNRKGRGGAVFLIGDAAHVHPPAGGQGLNLGMRDAIYLAPVLFSHLSSPTPTSDDELQQFAAKRRETALFVIGLANGMMGSIARAGGNAVRMVAGLMAWMGAVTFGRFLSSPQGAGAVVDGEGAGDGKKEVISGGWKYETSRFVMEWGLWSVGRVGFVRRFIGWRLGGLNHR